MALTYEQYEHAMKAMSIAQLDHLRQEARSIDIDDITPMKALEMVENVMVSPTKSTWDLTRPEMMSEQRDDVLEVLKERHPELIDLLEKYIVTFEFHHIYRMREDGTKDSHMAYAGGKTVEGAGEVPDAIREKANVLITEIAEEMGVDPNVLTPLVGKDYGYMKNLGGKGIDVDAQVEAFSAEMDDIFASWGGGDDT
jgi:hypothetical protein